MINIYCDESCHLENDKQKAMVIGGISCPNSYRHIVYKDIQNIKLKHHLPYIEIKWTKVSESKIEFYKELIKYFFNNELLSFRAVVIPDKKQLNHSKYSQTHDEFYYKTYYYLLRKLMNNNDKLNVYLDIKDTRSNQKIKKLKEILNNYTHNTNLKNIQHVRSHENVILQLTDLLIGATSYKNRKLQTSKTKLEIIDFIETLSNQKLNKTSIYSENKFDVFIMNLQR
ncbi:DUF3800 domain-containing protein [uncultured Gemella sp.]|uniref:DUF3800 domain-containing protein n=1 Tax=uncultured Gemella sp. TaxID=254352 RepID=UPI00262A7473|nr:DUF3800 domain-containing protein [uncultured Gemella sp.]